MTKHSVLAANENLCAGATRIASGGNQIDKLQDMRYPSGADCTGSSYCAELQPHPWAGGEVFITLDFGTTVQLSTIVFSADPAQNTDGFRNMLRTYGSSSSALDTTNNSVIVQSGGTNFPSMIADLNDGGPADLRYIHWSGDGSFNVVEILCYAKKRILPDQLKQNTRSYFQFPNAPLLNSDCETVQNDEIDWRFESPYPKVLRIVGITQTGEFAQSSDVEEMEIDMDNCDKNSAELGFDCSSTAIDSRVEVDFDGDVVQSYSICSIIILEDADGSLCTQLTLSQVLSNTYSYTIGDPTLVISKPNIQADSCTTNCAIGSTNPSSHSWFTETPTEFSIQSSDMSLVSSTDVISVNDITIGTSSPGSCNDSLGITVDIFNPCQDLYNGVHTTISSPTIANMGVVLDDPVPSSFTPPPFPDSVSTANGDPTFCGERQFAFTRNGADASDLITIHPNGDWHLQAASPSYSAGAITITVRVTLSHVSSSVYAESSFQVTICEELSLSDYFSPSYGATIGGPATEIYKPPTGTIVRDSCQSNCIVTAYNPSAHSWFTETSSKFEIQSNDMSLVSGQDFVEYSDVQTTTSSPGSCNNSFQPNLILYNPCQSLSLDGSTTEVIDPNLVNQQVNLNDPNPVVYTVGHIADSVSDASGDTTLCGARQLSFMRTDTYTDASDLITVQPNGDWLLQAASPSYSHGTITISVGVKLEHVDPSVQWTFNFDVDIICDELSLSDYYTSASFAYVIGQPPTVISRPPLGMIKRDSCAIDCGFLSMNSALHPWWIDNMTDFEVETSDMSLVSGSSQVRFTDISIITRGPGSCYDDFVLTIDLINPCHNPITGSNTQIISPGLVTQTFDLDNPNPLVYAVGPFYDTVSGTGAAPWLCGARQFTFTHQSTGVDASDLITVQSNGDWHIQAARPTYIAGTVTIQVEVSLEHADPAIVNGVFTFDVDINCDEKTLSQLLQSSYSYTIGDSALGIQKIVTGEIKQDSCALDCIVDVHNTANHSWFHDNAYNPSITIYSTDMTLVAGQDQVDFSDIVWSTSSPGICADAFSPVYQLKNPCQNLAGGTSTQIVDTPLDNSLRIILNEASPLVYSPPFFSDTISDSKGDPTFCGARQFAFARFDTGGDASDLITVQPNGDWHIQASSPSYTAKLMTIEVQITLEYVDDSILFSKTFSLRIDPPLCTDQSLSDQMLSTYSYMVGDPPLLIAKPTITMNSCATTCQVKSYPAFIWSEGPTDFIIHSDDVSIFDKQSSLSFDIVVDATNGQTTCDTMTIRVEVANPCVFTTLVIPPLNNQTVYLDDGDPLYYDVVFADQTSLVKGNYDGISFCGARRFEFSEPDLVTESDRRWAIKAESSKYSIKESPIAVTVWVTLDYLDASILKQPVEFSVILRSVCEETILETEATIEDMKFTQGLDQSITQLIQVKNTVSEARSDSDYCGAYNCTLSMQDGSLLPAHLTNAFQPESTSSYRMTVNGTSSAESQESQLQLVCSLFDWPSDDYPSVVDLSKSFNVQVLQSEETQANVVEESVGENIKANDTQEVDEITYKLEFEFKLESKESDIPLLVDEIVVSEQGLLMIHFNKRLAIPTIYEHLLSKSADRVLADDFLNQWIDVRIASDYYENGASEITISDITLLSFKEQLIEIMVDFKMPGVLSRKIISPEYLLIDFKQTLYSEDGSPLASETPPASQIPVQYTQEEYEELVSFEEQVVKPVVYLAISQMIVLIFLSGALKYLWNQIYIIQFIIMFLQWKVDIPAKVMLFLEKLKYLVFFEFIKEFYQDLKTDTACEDLENICKANQGITSQIDRLNNEGLMGNSEVMVLAGALLLLALIAVGLCYVGGKYSPKVKAIYKKIKGKVMWNSVIRYFFQSTLQLQVSAATVVYFIMLGQNEELTKTKPNNSDESPSSMLPYCLLIVALNLVPFFFVYLLYTRRETLETDETKGSIGNLYQTVNTDTARSLSYPIVFMCRRSMFVALTFFLMRMPAIQVQLHLIFSLSCMIYVTLVPDHRTSLLRKSEIFNEWMLLMTSYHMTIFTNSQAFSLGDSLLAEYSMNATIGFLLLVNALIIAKTAIAEGLWKYKLNSLKKKRDKVLKERDEAYRALQNHLEIKANNHFLDKDTRQKTLALFNNKIDQRTRQKLSSINSVFSTENELLPQTELASLELMLQLSLPAPMRTLEASSDHSSMMELRSDQRETSHVQNVQEPSCMLESISGVQESQDQLMSSQGLNISSASSRDLRLESGSNVDLSLSSVGEPFNIPLKKKQNVRPKDLERKVSYVVSSCSSPRLLIYDKHPQHLLDQQTEAKFLNPSIGINNQYSETSNIYRKVPKKVLTRGGISNEEADREKRKKQELLIQDLQEISKRKSKKETEQIDKMVLEIKSLRAPKRKTLDQVSREDKMIQEILALRNQKK